MSKSEDLRTRTYPPVETPPKGMGPDSAGASGDNQGLSDLEESNSESVEELVSEGQYYEAGIVNAVENTPDADVSEIYTKQVPEDDVPAEYTDADPDDPRE